MERIVKVESISGTGVSLKVTFPGLSLQGNRLSTDYRSYSFVEPLTVESPPFLEVEKAREWLDKLTNEAKGMAAVQADVLSSFAVLEGTQDV